MFTYVGRGGFDTWENSEVVLEGATDFEGLVYLTGLEAEVRNRDLRLHSLGDFESVG